MKLLQQEELEKKAIHNGFSLVTSETEVLAGIALTCVGYRDNGQKAEILKEANASINPGEVCAIIGESGSGKTTLLRALCGIEKATDGTVLYDRVDCYESPDAKSLFAYLPQDDHVHPELTVEEELRYLARLRCASGISEDEMGNKIMRIARQLGLCGEGEDDGLLNQRISTLSGGQRKRVAIAGAMLSDPKVLFLDEPTSPLDPGRKASFVADVLRGIADKDKGRSVVFVTHDFAPLTVVDKIIWVHAETVDEATGKKAGRVLFRGKLDDMMRLFNAASPDELAKIIYSKDIDDKLRSMPRKGDRMIPDSALAGSDRLQYSARLTQPPDVPPRRGCFKQFLTCLSREFKLMTRSSSTMVALLMPFLVAGLLGIVVDESLMYTRYDFTKSMLFAYSCAVFFIGVFNSIQTLSDRGMREVDSYHGLSPTSFAFSCAVSQTILALVQSALMCLVFFSIAGLPDTPFADSRWSIFLVSFLCCESAMLLGLLAGALFKRGTAIAPVLVLIQIVFSGIIFTLEDLSEKISYFITCKWAMNSFGTAADLQSLDYPATATGGETAPNLFSVLLWHGDEYQYDPNIAAYLVGVFWLVVLCVAALAATLLVLQIQRRSANASHHPCVQLKSAAIRYASSIRVVIIASAVLFTAVLMAEYSSLSSIGDVIASAGGFFANVISNTGSAVNQALDEFATLFFGIAK